MFNKNYKGAELEERLNLFWLELKRQADEFNADEFEFYWEIWGVLWMPWFIEIEKKSLIFTANDISSKDLDVLIKMGFLEVVKVYETSEMKNEFDRKRFRILNNNIDL